MESSKFKTALPQAFAIGAKNLVLLSAGMSSGFITILIPSLEPDPNNPDKSGPLILNPQQISWISSLLNLALPFGSVFSGIITEPLGRVFSLQMSNIPFAVCWILFYFATNVDYLYGSLILSGFSKGLIQIPILNIVSEISQPYLRGFFTCTGTFSFFLGMVTQYVMGTFFSWKTVALCNISVNILCLISFIFIPETPYWLISKNKFEKAMESLRWFRGNQPTVNVQAEYDDVYKIVHKTVDENVEKDENHPQVPGFKFENYRKKAFVYPFLLICYIFVILNFCGISVMGTYAIEIFQALKAPFNSYYVTIVLGFLQLIGVLVGIFSVNRVGKRFLGLASIFGCGASLLVVSIYLFCNPEKINSSDKTPLWIPTFFILLAVLAAQSGLFMLPYMLIGEIFSIETRPNAGGIVAAICNLLAFLSHKVYYDMIDAMTMAGTFMFYSMISLTGVIVLYFVLPETEGKPLAEIQAHFAGIKKTDNKVRRETRKNKEVENITTIS